MKRWIIFLALAFASSSHAQETTIRILGAYVSQHSLSASDMSAQLQGIANAWNSSTLPGAAVTTVQLLNGGVAVPVAFPGLPGSVLGTSAVARLNSNITTLRNAWQADAIILFRAAEPNEPNCGATDTLWYDGNFTATGGLDLRYRNDYYISVVVPTGCPTHVAAHEFGHMGGGGHNATGDRLYPDARAALWLIDVPDIGLLEYIGTALADPSDVGSIPLMYLLEYSRNEPGHGDASHQNVRTLAMTARSLANFYEYPTTPAVFNPPINLVGNLTGCDTGWTRHDVWWQNDPATNVPITHYDVWYSQPIGNPNVFGWTVYGPYSPVYVIGANSRIRARACSGAQCSGLSSSFYDAVISPACNW